MALARHDTPMRHGRPLPASPMPVILTVGIVVVGLIGAVLAGFGGR